MRLLAPIGISVFFLTAFCANAAPDRLSTMEQEQSEPFSYQSTSTYQIGFKDSPEATATTDGGVVTTHLHAFTFKTGQQPVVLKNRINVLEKGAMPILSFNKEVDGVVYDAEMFSAPENLDPMNNLITYIKWNIKNPGTEEKNVLFKMEIESFTKDYHDYSGYNPPVGEELPVEPYQSTAPRATKPKYEGTPSRGRKGKIFIRHNGHQMGWWRDRFMDFNSFKEGKNVFTYRDNCVFEDDHLVMVLPDVKVTHYNPKGVIKGFNFELDLKAGQSKQLVFKLPFVPIDKTKTKDVEFVEKSDYDKTREAVINFWDEELSKAAVFSIPEKKVDETFKASLVNLLVARDIKKDGKSFVQRCNEFQYDWFYVRDNAYFCRVYDMMGFHKECREILQPYFVFDDNGKLIGYEKRTGIFQKLCYDYWGQVLWAIGSYYRQNRDRETLELAYKVLPQHIEEFKREIAKDPEGLWPATWPYDNEHINGHYTGHSFWALLGMRYAILMANDYGKPEDAAQWQKLYDSYEKTFTKALDRITKQSGGYIPPGLDKPEDGYDWANASAGLYPFEAIDKEREIVKETLNIVRNYGFMEGVATYRGCNSWVVRNDLLAGKPANKERKLHQYEIFYVTESNLASGEQQKVVEDLYAFLVHTNSTNAGFEWGPTPWSATRSSGSNRAPHGWCGARYMELVRNMLVREEGDDIYLMSAISPEWARPGKKIEIKHAPTYGGTVSYTAAFDKNKMTLSLDAEWNKSLGKVYLCAPWFLKELKVQVDGKQVTAAPKMEIPKDAKQVVYTWDNVDAPELSFNKAVDIFLKKYYAPSETTAFSHLFATLLPPKRLDTKDQSKVSLYSPDDYAPIYYTTDGSQPTANSIKYSEPISTEGIDVIKAVCIDKKGEVSDCVSLDLMTKKPPTEKRNKKAKAN